MCVIRGTEESGCCCAIFSPCFAYCLDPDSVIGVTISTVHVLFFQKQLLSWNFLYLLSFYILWVTFAYAIAFNSPHTKKAVISLLEASQGLRIPLVKIGCLYKERRSLCSQLGDCVAGVVTTLSLELPVLDLWREVWMGVVCGEEVQDSLPAAVTRVSVPRKYKG